MTLLFLADLEGEKYFSVTLAFDSWDAQSCLRFTINEMVKSLQGPAAALLTLDQAANLDGQALKKRLSTLGCTILTAVFAFVKVMTLRFSA